ncbi:MAG: hypothetical protein SFY70_07605, partial [Bacteroidia bacterium]|nr:hypothetical protein [Bacteroidia bacterium]
MYQFCQGSGRQYNTSTATGNDGTQNFTTTAITVPVTIARWDFPNNPDDATADGGVAANLAQTLTTGGGAGAAAFGALGQTTNAATATGWDGTTGKYWQVSFSTVGYYSITVSSRQFSDADGPQNFQLQYSTDGSTYFNAGAAYAVDADFASATGTLTTVLLPAICSNAPTVFLRWTTTTVGATAGGESRIDDILVESRPIYYRTIAAGPFEVASNWEFDDDPAFGSAVSPADVAPQNGSEVFVTIRHNMTLLASRTIGNSSAPFIGGLTIQSGNTLSLDAIGITLTLNSDVTLEGTTPQLLANQPSGVFSFGDGVSVSLAQPGGVAISGTGIASSPVSNLTFTGTQSYSFTGADAQVVGALFPATVRSLSVDNSLGLTTSGPLTVTEFLTLTDGILTLGGTLTVNNASLGAIVGGSATAYVDGALTRATNTTSDYSFPIGDGGRFRRVDVVPSVFTSQSYTAEFFASNPSAAGFKVGPEFMYLDQTNTDANNSGGEELANVSSEEYYDINGTAAASIELPWAAETFASGADLGASFANARVAHWVTAAPVGGATPITNGAWVNEGGVSHIGDETAGRVRSGVVTTFSPFAIGSNDPINSLPIELLSFSGERVDNGVALAWNTASELNNDRFEIQRALSASFEGYQTIGTVAGSGTTTTETRYTYTDGEAPTTKVYYRLRQVDYDGTATLSRAIEVGGELSWYLDPNPSTSSQLEFGATGADIPATAKVGVQVVGTNGQVLLSQTGAYAEVRA